MSNIMQLDSFNDTPCYRKSMELNTTRNELNRTQNKNRTGTCPAALRDDAASVEISEQARAMYEASFNTVRTAYEFDFEDDALIAAEREYTEKLSAAADGFADFSLKITYGDYKGNDVSVKDLNFDALDQMENIYQSYKKQIETDYEGDERAGYLAKLDDVYNTVFAEKIIDPVKSAYDDKLTFFRPDSEKTTITMQGTFGSMESFQGYISNYMANQAINKRQYTALADGTKAFYNMADDTALWHDSDVVKNILNDSMKAYASVREVTSGSDDYLTAKEAADKIAKSISDKYIQSLENKVGMKNSEDSKWTEFFKHAITSTQSGMIMVNFSFDQLAGLSSEK